MIDYKRRDYSEQYCAGVAPLWLAWPDYFKIFFNNKGVVARPSTCEGYPRGDMSVWNWG